MDKLTAAKLIRTTKANRVATVRLDLARLVSSRASIPVSLAETNTHRLGQTALRTFSPAISTNGTGAFRVVTFAMAEAAPLTALSGTISIPVTTIMAIPGNSLGPQMYQAILPM
jgi:hypothetical protein